MIGGPELGAESFLAGRFSWVDWSIVFVFLVATTIVGERLSGRQATVRDFFLGGRQLPWYAVAASLVATEISAVTFISIPFLVYGTGGNIAYLQLGLIGWFVARILVGVYLVPAYYERELYSPYDYVGQRLGRGARSMTSLLFSLGGVLAQCARVYLTAVVLEVILQRELSWVALHTGVPPLVAAVTAIGLVAVLWTWIGGIRTVIWTDAILFMIFLAGMLITVFVIAGELDGGLGEIFSAARDGGKLKLFDFSLDPTRRFTFWVALIAAPWWMFAVFGTDQLFAQRIFCCRNASEARKAVIASQFSVVVTGLAALVGFGLYAYYRSHPLSGAALSMYEGNGDRIFPIFIVEVIPVGLKGLILAGVFAAAISSLDSIMAALSETVLSNFYLPRRRRALGLGPGASLPPDEERRSVFLSRVYVLGWAVALCALAVLLRRVNEEYPSILDMALAMATYTQGALLAAVVLALLRRRVEGSGFMWSAPLSVLTVYALAWHQPFSHGLCWTAVLMLAALWVGLRLIPGLRPGSGSVPGTAGLVLQSLVLGTGCALVLVLNYFAYAEGSPGGDGAPTYRVLAYPWYVPIGSCVAFFFALLLSRAPQPEEATTSLR